MPWTQDSTQIPTKRERERERTHIHIEREIEGGCEGGWHYHLLQGLWINCIRVIQEIPLKLCDRGRL